MAIHPDFHPRRMLFSPRRAAGSTAWAHASRFPHEETSDISYDPQQFAAYRDLGRHLAKAWTAGG